MTTADAGYDPGHLLVAGSDGLGEVLAQLDAAAQALGWVVELRNLDGTSVDIPTAYSRTVRGRDRYNLPTIYRAQIGPAPLSVRGDRLVARVDARRLLRSAGEAAAVPGVSLDHILSIDPRPGPGGVARTDERRPVRWVGPAPRRTAAVAEGGRRPVVAVLDTGCGAHPWLGDDVVTRSPIIDGSRVGIIDPDTAPDVVGDVTGALDGVIDPVSGHGTFIAGIVRQRCPDADLITARVTDSDGTVREGAFFYALRTLVKGMLLPAGDGGIHVDVLNLSLSSSDANPADLLDRALVELLRRARECGCAVVCSAGNDATDTPTFPAALSTVQAAIDATSTPDERAPHVSVGACSPDGSIADFSNRGPWVQMYLPGVDVLSAYPRLSGGSRPAVSTRSAARRRETLDIDDFGGGFALWSGTSFAAPYAAGALASALVETLAAAPDVGIARRVMLLHDARRGLEERFSA